nr:12783_t:CDS:2 [Entrophospora candida]
MTMQQLAKEDLENDYNNEQKNKEESKQINNQQLENDIAQLKQQLNYLNVDNKENNPEQQKLIQELRIS